MKEFTQKLTEQESRLAKMNTLVGSSFDNLSNEDLAELNEKDQRQSFSLFTKFCW